MVVLSVVVLSALVFLVADGAADEELCDRIIRAFNSLNQQMPMGVDFPGGEVAGLVYPPGRINLQSDARVIDNCYTYTVKEAPTMIAHLEFKENFEIRFSNTTTGKELSLEVADCSAVLHYYIAEKSAGGKKLLELNALMGEIRELGNVTLRRGDGGEEDFTREAEDLLRPGLLEAFNSFAKSQLRWTVDPVDGDVSKDGFESFKILFKRIMIELNPF